MKLQTPAPISTSVDLTPRLWVESVPTPSVSGTQHCGPESVHLMVCGDLDEVTSSSMEGAADAALDSDPEQLVLDLSGIVFIDTAGLRSIVATSKRAEQMGIRLVVGGMSGGVERLLELTGLVEQLSHTERWAPHPN